MVYVGAGNASSLADADVISSDHGTRRDNRKRVFLACRAMRPAIENSRRRGRFGSHLRASLLVNANICIQVVSSEARATIANQISFCENPCSGRFVRPVSFAVRIRSSQRARRRCRSSKVCRLPTTVLVTDAVRRRPLRSVKRS